LPGRILPQRQKEVERLKKVFLLVVCLLLVVTNVWAGYTVTTSVQDLGNTYKYTWTVTNLDQGIKFWTGMREFTVLVPDSVWSDVSGYPNKYGFFGYSGDPVGDWGCFQANNRSTSETPTVILPTGFVGYHFRGQGSNDYVGMGQSAWFSITTDKIAIPLAGSAYATSEWWNNPIWRVTEVAVIGPTMPVPELSSIVALLGMLAGLVLVKRQR
jgi:hypothetical protein